MPAGNSDDKLFDKGGNSAYQYSSKTAASKTDENYFSGKDVVASSEPRPSTASSSTAPANNTSGSSAEKLKWGSK